MKDEKISIVILFLFCLFIYPVMFKFSSTLSYAYIYGIPASYLLFNYKYVGKLTKRQLNVLVGAGILVFLSFLYPTFHGTGDYSYVRVATFIFRKLVAYVFLACVLVKKYKGRASLEHFIYYFALTHSIYVVGTLLMVFVPDFKAFWFSIFEEVVSSETLSESFGYTFRIGWQGFSGYRLTLHCTLSCIFLLYLHCASKKNFRLNGIAFFMNYMLCFLGNMFYGRSGLVLTIIASCVAFFIWDKISVLKILGVASVATILSIAISYLQNVPVFSDWYYWMSQPIRNFFTTGDFGNASLDRTHEMVFMPEWETLLFGDGYFVYNGHYYMNTDSGIMRNILFWGVVGWILTYAMTIYSIVDIEKKNRLLCLLILGVFLAFEYKGDVYYEFVALLLSASFVDSIANRIYGRENLK